MTLIDDTEAPAPRTGLFYGATLLAGVIGLAAVLGGSTVKPLLDVPALITQVTEQPPAAGPVAPPAEADSGVAEPQGAEVCETATARFSRLVCDTAQGLGWTVLSTTPELAPGVPFEVMLATAPGPVIGRGEVFEATRIPEGVTLAFTDVGSDSDLTSTVTAADEPLPAQATASVANDIRAALGQPEIWLFDGDSIAQEPSIYFGSGWSVATRFDAARAVGDVVVVGPHTLTVTASDEGTGTVYAVA
ncbi:hypothetical protein AB1K56_03335 [Microbacterium sp. BWR-S6Y]|uniref:hypothetical protein n=1 Tax=Microbacterium sp. BWR-S6Y TaxID=3232073 RepID=UPI0035272F73